MYAKERVWQGEATAAVNVGSTTRVAAAGVITLPKDKRK